MSDLRYALRALLKQPASTAVMVSTLAVAVAAIAIIYSVIDVVWQFIPAVNRDLVYAASTDSRTIVVGTEQRSTELRSRVSIPDLADWASRSTTFDELAGFTTGSATLTGGAVPQRVSTISATTNLTTLWGFTPAIGRAFRADEGRTARNMVALLAYRFWRQQFGGSPAVLGQSVLLDGTPHTVVGVLPARAGVGLFKDADVFLPLVVDPLRGKRDERTVLVTGRLKPGVTRERATNDLEMIARALRAEHPDTNERVGAVVLPLIEAAGFNIRVLISLLAFVALLVLVVACANIAGVVVAQSVRRQRETAIRAALGAGRADRVRRVMAESLLASLASGVLGAAAAAWGIGALRWLAGDTFVFADIHMNERVLGVGLVAALAAPLAFGMLPALRMPLPGVQALKEVARTAGSLRSRRTRSLLVALQAGVAIVLMLQIALFVRATWKLNAVAPGFDPARVLTFRVGLAGARYTDTRAVNAFAADLLTRLRALPGVVSAAITDRLPVADIETASRVTVEGDPPRPLEARPQTSRVAVGGDYFSTMHVPVKRGRVFSEAELSNASPVAVISDDAARRLFSGRDPIGSRLALDAPPGREDWLQVVGIVGDLRKSDVDQGALPQVYVTTSRRPNTSMAVVVKSLNEDSLQLVSPIRALVAQIDRNQPIHDVATMSRVLYDDLAGSYVLAAVLTATGVIALILCGAGVYGVVSHGVVERRREIGVRIALGARPGHVVRMIVAQGTRPVATGGAVGLVVAVALAVATAALLSIVDARDPMSYVGVLSLTAVVAVGAAFVPARHAAHIDPVEALRME